ncbi:tigger transposable element-derived protein 4-like [Parasteatoda tepidariorum]|nr:tigger transposable element-derived protein 4-like [Parasteatoda tepidariorum]
MRTGGNEEIEVALLRWVREARSQNLPLTGHVLQEKAKVFADALGVTNFASSNGWLTRFKKRHGIVCHKICGEEATVDKETVESFLSEKWPALRKNYAPRDIFNADETGLFFKALPSRTLSIKGEKCSGGKCSKERITVLVACNMDGTEKLPLFVVGKSANPRCFKNLKTLPVVYASNKKAWMNKMLFKKWLTDLDRKLFREKRNICLMLDNCSAHNDIHGLKAIKCVFLPPNTTAKLQPCDQGIIHSLKVQYRKEMVRKMIHCFDNKITFSVNLLDAMRYLKCAWNNVSSETIINSFKCGGFTDGKEMNLQEISEAEPETLTNLIEEAEKRGILSAPLFKDYTTIDEDLLTSDITTDQDIIAELSAKNDDVDMDTTDEESDIEQENPVTLNEATCAMKVINRFLMQQENAMDALDNLEHINDFINKCYLKKLKQKSITDFFQP